MSVGRMVNGPIFGDDAYHKRCQRNSEATWSVIANGKSIENGTTIRRNGVVSVSVVTSQRDGRPVGLDSENKVGTPDDGKDESENDATRNALEREDEAKKRKRPVLKINTSGARASAHEALSTVLQQLRWRESKTSFKTGFGADMYWHGLGFEESAYNKTGVYAVNKLPGMFELAQKVHLSRIIKRMQLLFPGEFDFYPPTWFLPEQYHQFLAEVTLKNKAKPKTTINTNSPGRRNSRSPSPTKKRKDRCTYIVKPDAGSQGEGIYLINDPRDVQDINGMKPAIIQKYIEDPLLIEGYKFDLRMYVVVARLNPIEIYLCKDGLARLCTEEYEMPTSSNIQKTFMHLTNYSLNKNSAGFVYTNAEGTGSKRSYRSVKQLLKKKGYDVHEIERQIKNLVVKTVLSMLPDITIWEHVTNKSKLVRSFQILGFDILLSSDMRAHLLEVNSAPSMAIDAEQENEEGIIETVTSHVDEQIKVPLLRDSLRLVAYGESEVNMEKSCLERVYPPKRDKQGVAKTKTESPRKVENPPVKVHERKETIRKEIRDLEERIKAQMKVVEKYRKYYEDNDTSTNNHGEPYNDYGQETDIPLSSRSLPAPTNNRRSYRDNFDTPRPTQATRLQYTTRRPKTFTVIKYKQEYAISTDEWRLFDPKQKPWQRSPIHPSQQRSISVLPSVDRTQAQQKPKKPPDKVSDHELFKGLPKCKICGCFANGAGPGLYYAQTEYKTLTDTKAMPVKSLCGVAEPVDGIDGEYFDEEPGDGWETDRGMFEKQPLPLRSIYFGEAKREEEEANLLRRRRILLERETNNNEIPQTKDCEANDHICDNCFDVASSSSSSDDVDLRRNGFSLERFRANRDRERVVQQTDASGGAMKKPFAMREVMLLNRAAAVFIYFNGIKTSLRISATAFRNMARRCRLCEQGAMPSIDILFIDTMRHWQCYAHDRTSPFYDSFKGRNPITAHQQSGLPFQGFVEALFKLAQTRFRGENLKEKMEALISNCELYIREVTKADKKKIHVPEQPLSHRNHVTTTPRISGSQSQRRSYF